MNDFGRRLEAAISAEIAGGGASSVCAALARFRDAVRAANAQCSAPAKCDGNHGGPSCGPQCWNDDCASGAGVDLLAALRGLREGSADKMIGGYVAMDHKQCRALLSHIESLERDAARYRWLRGTDQESADRAALRGGIGLDEFIDTARKEGK